MPANQQSANPNNINEDIQSVSRIIEQSIDAVDNLSIQSLYSQTAGRTQVGTYLRERATILRGLVNEIDRPILKSFANDMISTMAGWFEDPEVLCCLINALWVAYQENEPLAESRESKLADSKFGEFLDKLIAFIDLIIAFLTQDLKKLVFFIPDFIKEIFSALMGAILLVLQETLYTIRDSVLQSILDWIDDSVDGGSLWAQCLPMQQFLDILKKHVHDYGLFAELMEKIRGFVSGKKSSFGQMAKELVPNAKDLEFLFWMRDLLVKLKQAVVNFELCVEYAYVPNNTYANDPVDPAATNAADLTLDPNNAVVNPDAPPEARVPLIVSDDGQTVVLSDTDARLRTGDLQTSINGTYITRLSNDSVANFIKNNYGFSNSVVEQAMNKVTDGCPGFPGGQELKDYLDRIRNRNLA